MVCLRPCFFSLELVYLVCCLATGLLPRPICPKVDLPVEEKVTQIRLFSTVCCSDRAFYMMFRLKIIISQQSQQKKLIVIRLTPFYACGTLLVREVNRQVYLLYFCHVLCKFGTFFLPWFTIKVVKSITVLGALTDLHVPKSSKLSCFFSTVRFMI